MGIWAKIRDASGRWGLKVNDDGSLNARISARVPRNEQEIERPYTSFFTDSNGSENMIINPAVSPNRFCVRATGEDIYINFISIIITSSNATLDNFGGGTALTNGVNFFYESNIVGTSTIAASVKRNLGFFRSATGGNGFGNSDNAFRADTKGGGNTVLTYSPQYSLKQIYGFTHGLRLLANSSDQLCIEINDDLTGNFIGVGATFGAVAYGKII